MAGMFVLGFGCGLLLMAWAVWPLLGSHQIMIQRREPSG